MKASSRSILNSATAVDGKIYQLGMLQEEATELGLAARRISKFGLSEDKLIAFAEKMADVEILIEQTKMMLANRRFRAKVGYAKRSKILIIKQGLEEK
jgi:hypothetical protein